MTNYQFMIEIKIKIWYVSFRRQKSWGEEGRGERGGKKRRKSFFLSLSLNRKLGNHVEIFFFFYSNHFRYVVYRIINKKNFLFFFPFLFTFLIINHDRIFFLNYVPEKDYDVILGRNVLEGWKEGGREEGGGGEGNLTKSRWFSSYWQFTLLPYSFVKFL